MERRVRLRHAGRNTAGANYGWGDADQIALGRVDGPLESTLSNSLSFAEDGTVLGYGSQFNVVDMIAEATFGSRSTHASANCDGVQPAA